MEAREKAVVACMPNLMWPESMRKRTVPATSHGGQRAQGEPKLGAVRASQACPRGSGPQTRSWGCPPLLGYRKT